MGKLNLTCPHDDCGVYIGEYNDSVYQMPTYCPYCGKRVMPRIDGGDDAIRGVEPEE